MSRCRMLLWCTFSHCYQNSSTSLYVFPTGRAPCPQLDAALALTWRFSMLSHEPRLKKKRSGTRWQEVGVDSLSLCSTRVLPVNAGVTFLHHVSFLYRYLLSRTALTALHCTPTLFFSCSGLYDSIGYPISMAYIARYR